MSSFAFSTHATALLITDGEFTDSFPI